MVAVFAISQVANQVFLEYWGKNIQNGYNQNVIFYPNFLFISEILINFAAKLNKKKIGDKKMCKKCIVFGRVSSSRQDYTAQVNKVKTVAIADGYSEDEIAIVQGKESAIKIDADKRQTLKEMNELIEDNPSIESVYVFAIDRLSRHVGVIIAVAEDLYNKGVNLVFLNPNKMGTIKVNEKTGEKEKDYIGWMLLAFLSVGAEMEMKVKTERATNKKEEMKANNEVIGKLILGYKNVNRKATIDTKTGTIVKWIFKSYNEDGLSLYKIYENGVELGYWSNNPLKSSRASKIRQILMNYAYCGEPTKSGFIYPKLIEREEIDKAIYLMSQAQSKAKTISKTIALAKGKIFDKETSYALMYDGNHLKYFKRNDRTNKLISANLNIIDFCTWREASRIKWNLLANKDDNTRNDIGKELDVIDDRIYNIQLIIDTEINDKFDKLYKAYINSRGRITDEDYNKEVARIEKEENKYRSQIESLEQKKVELTAILKDINNKESKVIDPIEIMSITDYNHQKEITDEVIDKILVNRTDEGQYIEVYNKYESKPTVYLNKTVTNHTVIFELLNDNEALDISDEFKPRYKRTNK